MNSLEWSNVLRVRGHIIYSISFVLEHHQLLEVGSVFGKLYPFLFFFLEHYCNTFLYLSFAFNSYKNSVVCYLLDHSFSGISLIFCLLTDSYG